MTRKFNPHRDLWWVGPLLVIVLAAALFWGFTVYDQLVLRQTLDETFAFMRTRISNCENYQANDEAKSLVRLLDKTNELSRVMAEKDTPDEEKLEAYLSNQHLTGALVLDGQMQLQVSAGTEDAAPDWMSLLADVRAQDIVQYPEKTCMLRTEQDGIEYDFVVVARQDAPGVVAAWYRRTGSAEESGDLSMKNLFTGFTFKMSGVVAVSDGQAVISSNSQRLQGMDLDASTTLYSGHQLLPEEELLNLDALDGTWYGRRIHYKDYDLFAFFPEAQVYRTRTLVMASGICVALLVWLLVLVMRSHSEQATLSQSEKRLRIINALSKAYVAIMLVNLQENTVEILRSSKGPSGTPPQPMTGSGQWEQIQRLAAEEYRAPLMEFVDMTTAAERLREHDCLTYTWRTARGGWMLTLLVAQRWSDDGRLQAVLVANRDVTETTEREMEARRIAEKAADDARRANAAKTDFLRRMSHDVRTPINGIRGMVEISRHYPGNEEKQEECRKKILDASGFLLELVNNVLDMNKLESGQVQLDEVPFDLARLTDDTVTVLEVQARERGVELHYSGLQAEHKNLIGSPVHLRQVMQNVASNAIKYTQPGGHVELRMEERWAENGVASFVLTCADNGMGMSEEFQKHAFEPFAQEDSTARTAYAGTGLGLAITKELVERMGGTIRFTSKQGVGTTFVIGIPLRIDTTGLQRRPDLANDGTADVQGMRVLLVEDNELNMEIAQFLLENAGVVVTKAWNGQEAVDTFAASAPGSFDAILMDVMMPVLGGLDAARRIRAMDRPDAAAVPIIAMTANAFQEDVERSRAAGMNAHLTKPLDLPQLLRTLHSYQK